MSGTSSGDTVGRELPSQNSQIVSTGATNSQDVLSPDTIAGLVLDYQDVTAAAYTIRRGVKETPLEVWALYW